jgi:hypothetical protein
LVIVESCLKIRKIDSGLKLAKVAVRGCCPILWPSFFFDRFRSGLHFAVHLGKRPSSCSNFGARGMNALDPDLMTTAERLDEIAEILSAGLTRLRSRQSSQLSAASQESSFDCAAHQSGHANVLTGDLA